MKLRPISELSMDLNFSPVSDWPKGLPALGWRGLLVTGFDRGTGLALDDTSGTDESLLELLKGAYPQLGIAEAARLSQRLQNLNLTDSTIELMGWRGSPFVRELLNEIALWPRAIQDWCNRRRLAPGDLAILESFENKKTLLPLLAQLALRDSGKNQGVRILELSGELTLSGITLPEPHGDDQAWLGALENLRYPQIRNSDKQKCQQINRMPWPKNVRADWKRRGDAGVLEIQLQLDSPQALAKKLDELSRLTIQMSSEDPWKN